MDSIDPPRRSLSVRSALTMSSPLSPPSPSGYEVPPQGRGRHAIPLRRNWNLYDKARIYGRDFFTTCVHWPWRRLFLLSAICYFGSWMMWGLVLTAVDLKGECLSRDQSLGRNFIFWDYCFFAMETMSTIGFGSYHAQCRKVSFMVALMSFYSSIVDALVLGTVLGKFALPGSRGGSILISDTLCGHRESGTVAFRVQNVRKHAVMEPKVKVFLIGPPSNPLTAIGEMPSFRRLKCRMPESFDFLELPQVVVVKVPCELLQSESFDATDWFLHASFTATDPATGGVFELRKMWSLKKHLRLDSDFATVLGNCLPPVANEAEIARAVSTPAWFSQGLSVDLNRFHACVDYPGTPDWAWIEDDLEAGAALPS